MPHLVPGGVRAFRKTMRSRHIRPPATRPVPGIPESTVNNTVPAGAECALQRKVLSGPIRQLVFNAREHGGYDFGQSSPCSASVDGARRGRGRGRTWARHLRRSSSG